MKDEVIEEINKKWISKRVIVTYDNKDQTQVEGLLLKWSRTGAGVIVEVITDAVLPNEATYIPSIKILHIKLWQRMPYDSNGNVDDFMPRGD